MTPCQATKKPETKKPKNPNVITLIEFWTLVFYLCFLNFFSKESIIINIERNLCFVLQTKNLVKKINSVKANFDFFIRKSFFAMDLIWRSEKIIKLGTDLIWHKEKKN